METVMQYVWKNGRKRWIRGFAPTFAADKKTVIYCGVSIGTIERMDKGKYFMVYYADGRKIDGVFKGSLDGAIKDLFERRYGKK